MIPRFKVHTVIQANRSGSLAVIKRVDFFNEIYEYVYLNPTSAQFAGINSHSCKDIEDHWREAKQQNVSMPQSNNPCMEIMIQSCNHLWIPYFGLNEKFEYCKHCDEKKTT